MAETLFGGITFETQGGFPLSTDTVVLADFVRLSKNCRVCDLGLGSGALMLLLRDRWSNGNFSGIEIQKNAYDLACSNIISNHLEASCRAIYGDLRQVQHLLPANSCTHVVSNPPYFATGTGFSHQNHSTAREEDACTLSQLCQSAKWLLQFGGTFSLVYRPERLCDLICNLRDNQLEPKRIQFVRHRPSSPVSLVLLEAKLGGKPQLDYLPDLILYGADGSPTSDFLRIYRLEGD